MSFKERTGRKILSFLLALVVAAGFLPVNGAGIVARAEDYTEISTKEDFLNIFNSDNGGYYRITADISIPEDAGHFSPLNENIKVVIDLNGHTVSLQNDIIALRGELVIEDSAGGGLLSCLSDIFMWDNSTLTVNGGTIFSPIGVIDFDGSNMTLNINGGKLEGSDYAIGFDTESDKECNINGGIIDGGFHFYGDGDFRPTVTGGVFNFDISEYVSDSSVEQYSFCNENYWFVGDYINEKTYYVLNYIFNSSKASNPTLTLDEDYTGNITVTRDDGVIDLNGHTVTGNIFLQNNHPDKTVTVKNGTVTGEIDGAPAWNDFYKGKVVLENVTVGGTVWTDGHDYTVSSGTYNGIIYTLKNDETTGSTTITGGTFNNSLVAGFYNPVVAGGTFSISGGEFASRPAAEFLTEGFNSFWNGSRYTVVESELTEVTSQLINPSFENGTAGWEFKFSDDSGARETGNAVYSMAGSVGAWLFNTWGQGWSVHQTVTGLTNGKYRLTAVAASSGSVVLRANGVTGTAVSIPDAAVGSLASVEFYVTDGTATVGAEGVDNVWFKCDDFRLFYIDDSEPEPAETEENDCTGFIKNPDFEYGSGFGWTYDNSTDPYEANETGVFYVVSPYTVTGQSGSYIFNTYNGGIGYPISQTVTGLPNGRYQLKAAAGPADCVVIKGNGQTSEAGPEGETTVEFFVTDGTALIGAEGVNNSWFKVDNFRLYLTEAIEKVEASDAACSEPGNIEYYEGSAGNLYLKDGNTYVSTTVEEVTIPALGHTALDAVKENEVPATYTEEGSYDSVVYCSVCHEELSRETVTVPKLEKTELTINSIAINGDSTSETVFAETDTATTWTVDANGGEGELSYRFYLYKDGEFVRRSSFVSSNTCRFTPTEPGEYRIKVFVKDEEGTTVRKFSRFVTVTSGPLQLVSVKASATEVEPGTSVTLTAKTKGGEGELSYRFYLYKNGEFVRRSSFVSSNTCRFTPTESGVYRVKVFVKDANGTTVRKYSKYITVSASSEP